MLLQRIWRIAISQWFLNAYAVLMCLAPIVNLAFEPLAAKTRDEKEMVIGKVVMPLLFCVFGWSFATTLPIVKDYVPKPLGLTAYSFITLFGAYTVARFMRVCSDGATTKYTRKKGMFCLVVAVTLFFCAIGLNDYNSPFALLLAAMTFFAFKEIVVPVRAAKVAEWLAPSMFSVYLMHSHGHAWGYLARCEDWLIGLGLPIAASWFATALTVFSGCIALDMPRRSFARIGERMTEIF